MGGEGNKLKSRPSPPCSSLETRMETEKKQEEQKPVEEVSWPEPGRDLELVELFSDQGFADSFRGYKDTRSWSVW
jgi:hypothetical protein